MFAQDVGRDVLVIIPGADLGISTGGLVCSFAAACYLNLTCSTFHGEEMVFIARQQHRGEP